MLVILAVVPTLLWMSWGLVRCSRSRKTEQFCLHCAPQSGRGALPVDEQAMVAMQHVLQTDKTGQCADCTIVRN